jgi:flavin-dependent dehydrogenase
VIGRGSHQFDVAIIGGGPGGATLAALLAARGLRVAVVDAPVMSPIRRAESLSRGALNLIGHVGLESIVNAAMIAAARVRRVSWGSDDVETVETDGVLIDRNRFDRALLAAAVGRGAVAYKGWATSRQSDGASWRIAMRGADGPSLVEATLLVDASGRRGFGQRSLLRGPRTVAMVGRWRASAEVERVTAGPSGWGWLAPVRAEVSEVTVFVAPEALRGKPGGFTHCYAGLARSLELVSDASIRAGPEFVRAYDATPRIDQTPFQARFLRLGDAAIAIDPIASAGCQLAIQGAVSALGAILTLLGDPASEPVVAEYWRQEIERRWRRHSVWAATYHLAARARFETDFWRDRSCEAASTASLRNDLLPQPNCAIRLAADVQFLSLACRVGDGIARRASVNSPGLAEPLVFVEGVEIVPLLREAVDAVLASELVASWARKVGQQAALRVLSCSWRRRLLVDAACEEPEARRQLRWGDSAENMAACGTEPALNRTRDRLRRGPHIQAVRRLCGKRDPTRVLENSAASCD